MPERLSVTHVVLSLEPGGLERVVLDLIREGSRLGQTHSVVCINQRGRLADTAEQLSAPVVCLEKGEGLQLGILRPMNAAFRTLQPHVLHTHQIGALFYAGSIARRRGIPVIHTEHGKHFPGRFRHRCLGRIAARSVDRFVCVSGEIADLVVSCKITRRSRVSVQANGIDTNWFIPASNRAAVRTSLGLGLSPTAPILGTVGRLVEVKRYDRLISAFAHVHAKRPDAVLVFIGDGPLRGELERLAQRLGLASAVHFVGFHEDPRPFLQALDVFTLTSESEGMPLSVLEAWSAGLAVVASNVGGLPDMIDHGVTGLLVNANDESALVAAYLGLLDDPIRARRIGEAGQVLARERYDVRVMAKAYDQHYRGILQEVGATV